MATIPDPVQGLLGLGLWLLPGLVWAWRLGAGVPVAGRLALAVVLAATLAPALLFVLHLLIGVSLTPIAFAATPAVVAAAGLLAPARSADAA